MLHHDSAYELEGLDALDLQLLLDSDYNHAEYDIEDDAVESTRLSPITAINM